MRHATKEDYLRAIFYFYDIKEDKCVGIKSVDIARFLNISKPSVCGMVKKLSQQGLIKSGYYSNIFLTESGLKEAKRITYKHRIIEVFLTKILGHRADNLESEVHNLEHAFSDNSIIQLDKLLRNPKICPHGNIIRK